MARTRGKSAKTSGRGNNPFQRPLGARKSSLPGEIRTLKEKRAREAQQFALGEMNLSPREIDQLLEAVKIKSGRSRGMPNISKAEAQDKRRKQKNNGFKRRTG